ncbi:MAG TPA: AI-2E family transporter, partial [Microbacterium sp.]|nr:AI-2E family transporter [Microbacterium sp.]
MGLFRRTPPRPPAGAIVDAMVEKPPLGMWADGFGRLATRSLQTLIVLGIATLLFIGLRSVTVVTIPVLLALIFASAFAPAMHWMRRRGVPSALASVITLLAIVLILGGVGWLIVWAVRGQWDELDAQGEEGFQTLIAWIQDLPFAPTDDQLEGARTAIVDFVTSAQFGSGALAG